LNLKVGSDKKKKMKRGRGCGGGVHENEKARSGRFSAMSTEEFRKQASMGWCLGRGCGKLGRVKKGSKRSVGEETELTHGPIGPETRLIVEDARAKSTASRK